MKKALTLFAIALATFGAAHAQTTGTTNLHVSITDAYSISVNDPSVTLTFATATNYQVGVQTVKTGHLTVTSNQPYDLDVKSAAATLAGTGGNLQTINASTITVELNSPLVQALGGVATPVTALSTSDQRILTGATAVTSKNIDIKYSIPAAISQTAAILGKQADDYTTVVTYTISQ